MLPQQGPVRTRAKVIEQRAAPSSRWSSSERSERMVETTTAGLRHRGVWSSWSVVAVAFPASSV
jgi:hypothetical protein